MLKKKLLAFKTALVSDVKRECNPGIFSFNSLLKLGNMAILGDSLVNNTI